MSYKEDYYEEVDAILNKMKSNPFEDKDINSVRYEDSGQVQPVGWVENADSVDGEAKVIINADGITILDGKIFLSDYGGASVLGPAGFSGSWIDFLTNGTYNGSFANGTLEAIIAATMVNTASTIDDYSDSLSPDLPYWVVRSVDVSGGGNLGRVVDAESAGGFALRWSGDIDAAIFQDIPVTPGYIYSPMIAFKIVGDDYEYQINSRVSWRDENHAIIGSESAGGEVWDETLAAYFDPYYHTSLQDTGLAPANAAFLRVQVEFIHNSGHADVYLGQVDVFKASTRTTIYSSTAGGILDWASRDDAREFQIGTGGSFNWTMSDSTQAIMSAATPGVLRITSGHLIQQTSITPAQFTANQVDYAPTGGNKAYMWRLSSNASRNLTGIVPIGTAGSFYSGEVHLLVNIGANNIVLVHDSVASAAGNRFQCPGGGSYTLTPGSSVLVVYDGTPNPGNWRVVG